MLDAFAETLQETQEMLNNPEVVLAIEPMLNAGSAEVKIWDDHWTAVTADGRPSVHFEHTIAVTADGPRLITAGVGGAAGMLGFAEF